MAHTAVMLSFRLGGTDGVSVEAAKWESALRSVGYETRRVAGEILDPARHDDTVLPDLAIGATGDPSPAAVEASVDGADLVVVENLLSLPLNLGAARTVAKVLAGHDRVVLRHHDLPWQRPEHAAVDELPPRIDGALHVVINELSRRQLAERGVAAHVVRNHFDFSSPPGDREATRRRLHLEARGVLVLHPVRAIARKNVAGAVALCEELQARVGARVVHYWLPGPAEDGYQPELDRVLAQSSVPVLRDPAQSMGEAYAACDLVVFPSTWEGFGNPVIESVAARRPIAVGSYPVLGELEALGLEFLSAGDPNGVAAVAAGERDVGPVLERNLEVARAHLALELLPGRIEAVLAGVGWQGM